MQCSVIAGFAQRLLGVLLWLTLVAPLILLSALPARAFDAQIRNYQAPVPLAGFESTFPFCRIAFENLRVGASPTGTANVTGTSFIDFSSTVANGSYSIPVQRFAATSQELFSGTRDNSFFPAVTASLLGDMCRISELQIVQQTSPNATTYAAAAYHGIRFRGLQEGVRYEWEVAFVGQTNTQLINTRTVVPAAPAITSVNPNSGPATGGTSVTINGTNLGGATEVNFGGTVIPSANFIASSASAITVNSPARAAGQVDITVTTAGGASANTNNDNFTYFAVPVLGLTAAPSAGQQTEGRSYTFTVTPSASVASTSGTLTLTTTLPVNQFFTSGSGTGWTCNAPGQLVTCTSAASIAAGSNGNPVTITVVPAGANGGFSQAFTLSGGGASAAANATAASVTVNGLPQTQVAVASTTLTRGVLATPFTPVTRTSGGTAPFTWSVSPALPPGLTLNSDTGEIRGTPTAASPIANYVFTVTDARGAVQDSNPAFKTASITVLPPLPTVESINPTTGPLAGGTLVTINGTNFTGATRVIFGGNVVPSTSFASISDSVITVPSPARAAGTVRVSVTTAAGESVDAAQDDFTYVATPTITPFTFGSTVAYNSGGGTATAIDVATGGAVTGAPTVYMATSGTTTGGGTVSISNAGIASYTPPVGFRGTDSFEVNAANAGGTSTNATITVTVGNPSFFATVPVSTGTAGIAYSQPILIVGGASPYTSFSATGLPPGLSISPTGLISGTPTEAGTFASVVTTVTDSSIGTGPFTGTAPAFSITINQGSQSITFTGPGPQVFAPGATVALVATGGASGLPVTFASTTPDICTTGGTHGATLRLVGVGSCSVTASQAGSATFAAAADVTESFDIGPAAQSITFPDPVQSSFRPGDQVKLIATASSRLPVEFTSLTPDACTVTTDGVVRFIKLGACTVAADQPGNATISPAARVSKTLNVDGVDPLVETDLITKMQTARARALILNQPDLTPLLDVSPDDTTALSFSSKGAEIDLIRMGGPVWLRLSGSIAEQAGGTRDHYVQLSFGSHIATGPQSILGVMATLDSIRMTDPAGQVEGTGWLIGPYFVSRLGTSNVIFEMRALTGRTEDHVAQTGAPFSSVEGKRSLLMAKLSGTFEVDERLTLTPSMSVASVNQASASYLALGGTPIPGVSTTYQQAALGLNLKHISANSYGQLTTTGGLGWFMSETSNSVSGQGLSYSFGLAQEIGDNSNLSLDVLGQRDFQNDATTVGLSLKFESRF